MRWILASSLVLLVALPTTADSRDLPRPSVPPPTKETPGAAASPAATASSSALANFTFDDGLGGPDPQGWVSHDLHINYFNYFHVDDFVDAGVPYAPLSGSQSLWCGRVSPCDGPAGGSWPGYGNNWHHYFESRDFAVTGNVVVTYMVKYDLEATYDYAHLQYRDTGGTWQDLLSYTGSGQQVGYTVVSSANHTGTIRFRFAIDSDGAYSDEDGFWPTDGAIIIDDLIVADDTGTVDFQDFETESVGAQTTTDGDWTISTDREGTYGNYGALFDGSTVLQEDSFVTDTSYLWGFFNGSTYNYSCAGHAEQVVVPYGRGGTPNDPENYIDNVIASPWIDLSHDLNGLPFPDTTDSLVVSFDVYRHVPLDALVVYYYGYRFQYNDCDGEVRFSPSVYYWNLPQWYRFTLPVIEVPAGATDVQVVLGVADYCPYWCGLIGTGACHTHGPLFDNVLVARPGVVTAADDGGAPVAYALHPNVPNPFNPSTVVSYDVPAGGGDVSIEVFDVHGRRVTTLLHERRPAGTWSVQWDGRDARGRTVATGIYFCRLAAPGVSETRKMVLIK